MTQLVKTDEQSPELFDPRLLWVLLLAIIVYASLTITADWADLSAALVSMEWRYLPAVLLLATMNYLIRFLKWHYFIRHLSLPIGKLDNLVIFLSGLTMSVTPGKMGEVLKSYLLQLSDGTPISRSAPVVFAERLTDLIALMIIAVIGGYALSGAKGTLVAGSCLVVLLVIFITSRRLHEPFMQRLRTFRKLRTIADKATASMESARALVTIRPLLITSVISIPAWLCECIGFWLVLKATGVHDLGLLHAAGIYALAAVIGALSMLPGGLGATELTITGLLTAGGAAKAQAVAATLIIRAATLWYAVFVGIVFLGIFRLRGSRSLGLQSPSLPSDAN